MSAVSVAPRSGISATMRMSTALTEALLRRSTHPCLFMEDRMDRELRACIRRAGSCRWVEMGPPPARDFGFYALGWPSRPCRLGKAETSGQGLPAAKTDAACQQYGR